MKTVTKSPCEVIHFIIVRGVEIGKYEEEDSGAPCPPRMRHAICILTLFRNRFTEPSHYELTYSNVVVLDVR